MGEALAAAVFEQLDGFDGAGCRYEVPCRLVEEHTT
jgi:hypothetical protein